MCGKRFSPPGLQLILSEIQFIIERGINPHLGHFGSLRIEDSQLGFISVASVC